jgi:hypothetical protein
VASHVTFAQAELKLKGEVPLRYIRAVENVDRKAFNRGSMFQVRLFSLAETPLGAGMRQDAAAHQVSHLGSSRVFQLVHDEAILYLEAQTQVDRADWIDAIRKGGSTGPGRAGQPPLVFLLPFRLAFPATKESPHPFLIQSITTPSSTTACEFPHNVASKHKQHHPGAFLKGAWTCCKSSTEGGGCKVRRGDDSRCVVSCLELDPPTHTLLSASFSHIRVRAQEAHHYYGEAEEKPVVSIKAEKGTSRSHGRSAPLSPARPPPPATTGRLTSPNPR